MTKEDFEQWKNSPVTKEIMGIINDARSQCAENVIKCSASGEHAIATRLSGNIETLDFFLNIQFEETQHD